MDSATEGQSGLESIVPPKLNERKNAPPCIIVATRSPIVLKPGSTSGPISSTVPARSHPEIAPAFFPFFTDFLHHINRQPYILSTTLVFIGNRWTKMYSPVGRILRGSGDLDEYLSLPRLWYTYLLQPYCSIRIDDDCSLLAWCHCQLSCRRSKGTTSNLLLISLVAVTVKNKGRESETVTIWSDAQAERESGPIYAVGEDVHPVQATASARSPDKSYAIYVLTRVHALTDLENNSNSNGSSAMINAHRAP